MDPRFYFIMSTPFHDVLADVAKDLQPLPVFSFQFEKRGYALPVER